MNLCVFMCVCKLTVSLKLSESQRFLNTATTEEGGLSRSSNASIRMKSNTMSKKFIHTTCRDANPNSTLCETCHDRIFSLHSRFMKSPWIWGETFEEWVPVLLVFQVFDTQSRQKVSLFRWSTAGDGIVPKERKISKTILGSWLY